MQNIIVKLFIKLLSKNLSIKNRVLLTNTLIDKLDALPLKNIIEVAEDGTLKIRGKTMNYEEMNLIQDSADALRNNRVFGIISDEVMFRALSFGMNTSTSIEQLYFSKASIWWLQEMNNLLKILSGKNDQPV